MEQTVFIQLSLVMVLAAGLSLLARKFRQPLVIAYLLTGFLAGPSFLQIIHNRQAFESFSSMGIALLLFIIGLGLNVTIIRTTGVAVVFNFLIRGSVLALLGLGIGLLLGFTKTESLLLGTALLFSSTIIVIKALSDKREQSRLYGQLAIGLLLVEDLVATIALVVVSAVGSSASGNDLFSLLGKGVLVAGGLTLVARVVMPHLGKLFAASQELLYIFAIGWAFGVATLFHAAGFSIEVGALFAGVSLAHLPYAQAIATKLKPLRDFFIVLFFITLGESLQLGNVRLAIVPALLISFVVLYFKPLLTLVGFGILGYTKQTGFKTGIHLTQISEFSIVLVVLAQSFHLASDTFATVITLTAFITITASAYLMKYDDRLYQRLSGVLTVFERGQTKRELQSLSHYPLVLLGYRQGGYGFVKTFRQMKKPYVVIDYDPEVIESLEHQHINHLYGDATDVELLEEIDLRRSELVISTITDASTNSFLASHITKDNPEAVFICHAADLNAAGSLYDAGATYVLIAHFAGTDQLKSFIQSNGSNKRAFAHFRKEHLLSIGNMVTNG